MHIQILSDIHFDVWRCPFEFPVTAPFLALLGDIGDPQSEIFRDFIYHQATRFDIVFLVAGNHDFYQYSHSETILTLKSLCTSKSNIILLNKDIYDLSSDIRIAGCTLWSNISELQEWEIKTFMMDFRKIKHWTINDNNEQHQNEKNWLIEQIDIAKHLNKKLVIFTHHAPSYLYTCRPEHVNGPLTSAFCSDLDHLMKSPVILWGFGHSHCSCDKMLESGCRLVANQRGYPGERTGFNAKFTIHLKDI